MAKTTRVRFAPAPTGIMHLGNIRAALINYLFAKQKGGNFILRIEDTDPQRNFDPEGKKIREDLAWLGLSYDEGPEVGGPFAPYFQSQRNNLYQEKLEVLKNKHLIYRCFCTQEELEKKRQRQRALKLPPRYDRTCLHLTQEKINQQLEKNMPFVWRFKLDHAVTIEINDLAHNKVRFELNNFSDFPITRQNGSFTFMFANFVDDLAMQTTHVFRGEDHLTNTAGQAALFHAVGATLPTYWHMPIMCNIDGKKLSKRDFGFSLRDLKNAGYLPEAICNYLAIIGSSFKKEIMSLDELAQNFDFENIHTTGCITYDVEKLKWVNRKWIDQLKPIELAKRCRPNLLNAYPEIQTIDDQKLVNLLQIVKTEMITLNDSAKLLSFYFARPNISSIDVSALIAKEHSDRVIALITENIDTLTASETFVENIKQAAREKNIPLKEIFWFLRMILMGETNGVISLRVKQ